MYVCKKGFFCKKAFLDIFHSLQCGIGGVHVCMYYSGIGGSMYVCKKGFFCNKGFFCKKGFF